MSLLDQRSGCFYQAMIESKANPFTASSSATAFISLLAIDVLVYMLKTSACVGQNTHGSYACTIRMSEYMAVWVGDRPKEKHGRGERKMRRLNGSVQVSFCSIFCNFLLLAHSLSGLCYLPLYQTKVYNHGAELLGKILRTCTPILPLLRHSPISSSTSSFPCGRLVVCAS